MPVRCGARRGGGKAASAGGRWAAAAAQRGRHGKGPSLGARAGCVLGTPPHRTSGLRAPPVARGLEPPLERDGYAAARGRPPRPWNTRTGAHRRCCTLRLHSISLENFKSFRDEAVIPLSQTTCLIGPNSAGKSNILHGLKTLSSIIAGIYYAPEPGDYFNNDTDREMKLAVVVELSDDERKYMAEHIDAPAAAPLHGDLGEWLFKRLKYEVSLGNASQTHAVSLTFTDADYHVFASVTQDDGKYTAQRRDIDMIDTVGKALPDLEPFHLTSTKIDYLLGEIDKPLISIIKDMFSGISDIGMGRSIPQSSSPHESHGITPDGSNLLNEVNSLPLEKKIEFNKFIESITGGSISGIEASMKDSELVLEAAEPGLGRRTPSADLSSGQEQLVLLAMQLFARPGTAFILTEPELHLHAKAQRQVRRRLKDASSQLQIVIETHSPIFLGAGPGEAILLITKSEGSSHVTPIGPDNLDVIRHELGVAHSDSLHHENILFVEGDSEHVALPRFMSALGYDLAPKTAVFNLGGAGRIRHLPLLLRYFKADGRRVFVILDNDEKTHSYTKKLAKNSPLDKNFFIFDKSFEDAFASATIMDAVKGMCMHHGCKFSLTADDLDAERAKGRRVDAVLEERWLQETGHVFNKVDLAKLLAGLPSGAIPDEIKSALRAAADHFGQGGDGGPAEGGDTGGENPP